MSDSEEYEDYGDSAEDMSENESMSDGDYAFEHQSHHSARQARQAVIRSSLPLLFTLSGSRGGWSCASAL